MNNISISSDNSTERDEKEYDPRQETDNWVGEFQYRVPADQLKRFSRINEFWSIFHILTEWVAIFAAVWLCSRYWNPLLYAVAVMWIGARQHALVILMHEGTHYRLFRQKWVNEIVSDLFLAWPMFITTRAYRVSHFGHHRNINTDDDPDWVRKKSHEWEFPKSWGELGMILLRDVTAFNSHQILAEVSDLSKSSGPKNSRSQTAYLLSRIFYYVCVLLCFAYFHLFITFLLFWVVPFATWFKLIIRVRGIAEHYAIDEGDYGLSRTTLVSWFDKLFVAPKNINYHLEHHLYPSVPFYRLPQLHKLLMSMPGYRQQAHVTQTYWGVLRECVNFSKSRTP